LSDFDLRQLRNAFGTFLTGVTVVTSREENGIPRGFTANSFTSVSLDPPMLLICVDKAAESFDVFTQSEGFAVNILTEDQVETSGLFASKRADKFDVASWSESKTGNPILDDVCAWFDCKRDQVIDAGDHIILLGCIQSYDYNGSIGLGYVRGGYLNLGLEQSAVKAVASGADTIVGAVVELDGKLLLIEDTETNELHVPASGLDGTSGSLSKLQHYLAFLGVGITLSSLFAVFENEDTGQQSIYYRAKADSDLVGNKFWAFDEIPWERLSSPAITVMLKRYVAESKSQRFGIYFGSDRDGAVKELSK
jgi:flavin reductase (DIM6/NTAB) family NADH-FMN oxidoreductase RutF